MCRSHTAWRLAKLEPACIHDRLRPTHRPRALIVGVQDIDNVPIARWRLRTLCLTHPDTRGAATGTRRRVRSSVQPTSEVDTAGPDRNPGQDRPAPGRSRPPPRGRTPRPGHGPRLAFTVRWCAVALRSPDPRRQRGPSDEARPGRQGLVTQGGLVVDSEPWIQSAGSGRRAASTGRAAAESMPLTLSKVSLRRCSRYAVAAIAQLRSHSAVTSSCNVLRRCTTMPSAVRSQRFTAVMTTSSRRYTDGGWVANAGEPACRVRARQR